MVVNPGGKFTPADFTVNYDGGRSIPWKFLLTLIVLQKLTFEQGYYLVRSFSGIRKNLSSNQEIAGVPHLRRVI